MNGGDSGSYTGSAPDMGALESSCGGSTNLSVSLTVSAFAFGVGLPNSWLGARTSVITNDGNVAENFVGQISQFTDGSNSWSISPTVNGADSIRARWSTTSATGPWTSISAYDSDFSIATNVAVSDSVVIWFQIQTPVSTTSFSEHASALTVTAQEF